MDELTLNLFTSQDMHYIISGLEQISPASKETWERTIQKAQAALEVIQAYEAVQEAQEDLEAGRHKLAKAQERVRTFYE